MALFSAGRTSWSPTAVADAATFTSGQLVGTRPSTTGMLRWTEVFIGGEASSSTINVMAVRRGVTTVSAGALSGITAGQLNPRSVANASGVGTAYATTYPTAASGHVLQLSLNAFGGIIRWVAAPGEELYSVGAATLLPADADLTFSGITGTGQISSHIIFEEM